MQLIGTGKQRASKTARILVGATALAFASWNLPLTGEDFPTVNFESYNVAAGQSFREGILGDIGVDNATFGGDWDAGANPLGAVPGLYPRDDLANVSMYTSRLDVILWNFPYFRVRSATNGAQVGQKVTFQAGGSNQGPFTYPTGSV
jgi:hypothetical protein